MQLKIPLLACSTLALVVLCGCPMPIAGGGGGGSGSAKVPTQKTGTGSPIATIGDYTLTTGDLQERLDKQSPFVRARYATPERKKEFLDNQVRFEVLAREAFRRGYDQDTEVVESLKKILVQKLTRQEFDGRVNLKDIQDTEIKGYYDSHTEDYNKPEMVRTSHIFLAFGDDKAKSRARADEAHRKVSDPAKLEDRDFFKSVVTEYTEDDATRRTGGDLRYLGGAEMEERFVATARTAVWATEKINDVTGVVEGNNGWHVFKRTGRRKPIERSLEQVRNQIRNVLYREKRTAAFQDFVEELKREFGVKVFADKLAEVKVDASPPGAPPQDGHAHGMGAPPPGAKPPGSAPRGAPTPGQGEPQGDPR